MFIHTSVKAAGLEVVSEVLTTQALLISSKTSKHKDVVEIIRKRIVGYLTATKYVLTTILLLCTSYKHNNCFRFFVFSDPSLFCVCYSYMMVQYNVSNRQLPSALKITPGKRSPTISPLQGEDGTVMSSFVYMFRCDHIYLYRFLI